jgi:hypothetical protein
MDYYFDLMEAEIQLVYEFSWCSLLERKKMFSQIIKLCDNISQNMVWIPALIESDDWETGELYQCNPNRHAIVEGTVSFNTTEMVLFQRISFNENIFWDDMTELEILFHRWMEDMVNNLFYMYSLFMNNF